MFRSPLTNYPNTGTVMPLSLDNWSGERPPCSRSDANCSILAHGLREAVMRKLYAAESKVRNFCALPRKDLHGLEKDTRAKRSAQQRHSRKVNRRTLHKIQGAHRYRKYDAGTMRPNENPGEKQNSVCVGTGSNSRGSVVQCARLWREVARPVKFREGRSP